MLPRLKPVNKSYPFHTKNGKIGNPEIEAALIMWEGEEDRPLSSIPGAEIQVHPDRIDTAMTYLWYNGVPVVASSRAPFREPTVRIQVRVPVEESQEKDSI